MSVNAKEFIQYFKKVVEVMENEKDYLCELDRKLGDGDHGVTMSIGWKAVNKTLDAELAAENDCGKISSSVGMTFLNAVGSSVGPLYATGFMRGGKAIKGKTELKDEDLKAYWIAFADGVRDRSQAEVGDKTMIDTLAPFEKVLSDSQGNDFKTVFTEALEAGEKGMKSTINIASNIGRSGRLGERSIGHQDPGATSAYYILSTFAYTS